MTSDDDDDLQDLPTSRPKQGLYNHIATSSGGHYNDFPNIPPHQGARRAP